MWNSIKDTREHISRLVQMHSNSKEDIRVAYAGDIVAIGGLKSTTTGETLCDPEDKLVLEHMDFPDPMVKVGLGDLAMLCAA